MTTKVAVEATKPFNRNLEGRMVTGHPKHPDPRGRYHLLSASSAIALVDAGVAKPMTREAYDKAMREADGDADRPEASEIRNIRTEAAGGGTNTGGTGDAPVKAKVTMSNEVLDALAAERKIDISGARTRGEKARLINGGGAPSGDGKSDVTTAGATGNLSDASTNHPGASSPHKGTGPDGTVVDRVVLPGEQGAGAGESGGGVDAEEDAAPRGGGGTSA